MVNAFVSGSLAARAIALLSQSRQTLGVRDFTENHSEQSEQTIKPSNNSLSPNALLIASFIARLRARNPVM